MSDVYFDTIAIHADTASAISRATYFVLEASVEFGDHYLLASIREAERKGEFALHIGVPDQPDDRRAETFATLEEGMLRLAELRTSHPHTRLWLSTLEALVEIEGANVWEGVVHALAGIDPTDEFDPWRQFVGMITRARSYGVPLRPFAANWLPNVGKQRAAIETVIDHL